MKRIIVLLASIVVFSATTFAQNLQVHYNLGKANDGVQHKRIGYLTTTLEMFKTDSLGYTFFFVDMDYKATNGMSFAYGEIVRAFNIPKVKFMKLELSYNGGTGIPKNTWLAGPVFPFIRGKKYFSISLYYRMEKFQQTSNGQITAVWIMPMLNGKLKFDGFFDVWSRDNFVEGTNGMKMLTFLTEPQLWYNLNDHIALGGEVELSYNFFTFDKKIAAMPTVAVKWNF